LISLYYLLHKHSINKQQPKECKLETINNIFKLQTCTSTQNNDHFEISLGMWNLLWKVLFQNHDIQKQERKDDNYTSKAFSNSKH
jgi:hypothetical protein